MSNHVRHLNIALKLYGQFLEPFVVSLSNHERHLARPPALRQAQGERLFMRQYFCRYARTFIFVSLSQVLVERSGDCDF